MPPSCAVVDTILPGQALAVNDKLISRNGRYVLGFFEISTKSTENTASSGYLGIWFNTVPKFTSEWVANRDSPIHNTTSLELTISKDCNLVIFNRSTKSVVWSTQANIIRTNSTIAMLMSSGNIILRDYSNSSKVFWQSFDHPTDTLLPGPKIGWDKVTGLKRRLVSWKSSMNPATGVYRFELDPSGVNQIVSSGVWNGKYFSSPENPGYTGPISSNLSYVTLVNNDQEKYFAIINIVDEHVVVRLVIEASGQAKEFIWFEGSQDWSMAYAQPKAQCDVYAVCGPFAICNDDVLPHCSCLEGFTITSPEDWELDDHTGGRLRNNHLGCISNKSTTPMTDTFYSMPCVQLPQNAQEVEAANKRCAIWHNGLLNLRQLQCSSTTNSNGETIYICVSGKDVQSLENNRRQIVIGVVIGFLKGSISIAVKRLDHAFQGEKQFRAEVSSIGAVQHINLVKLVGFCCEGSKRLLVYEHMSNSSLDIHLFRNNSMVLNWDVRYQIALGVARGLAYLHESCRHNIIHCDIKPENILLDGLFVPKIADFGMAKIFGRDFSRVLTTMRGTFGYLAREWITGIAITPKVDVYSYGMVLLEIISGKRNSQTPCSSGEDCDIYFPVHVAHKLVEGDVGSLADQMLHGDVNLDEVERACKIACWCIQDDEFDRPTMGEVVQILEGLVEITNPPMPRLLQAMTEA
ncbi:hypothetical protein BRADI_4g13820v3 [Brachypodium distachyon]|uniref:non-specific serine/threonine protein kinase n=1 Tax=Brachypodium distachyon TaxID=15368 RepID=A0A0Q3EJG3_BRADI|nr:hypothetical protein BRADI_4g13820v3 [Brachypodium distachyon]